MKKSLFSLFTSLIVYGLLLVGNTEAAFKYIASGDSTISISEYCISNISNITYGSMTKNLNDCEPDGRFGYVCSLTGNTGEYEVNVNFNSSNAYCSSIYLKNATKIIDYGSNAINELFLDSNNRNIDLNDKEPSNIAHFYTQNNNLKTFKLKLNNSENPKSIMFQQNLLENIPEEIRCNRNYNGYNIEITSSYRIIENNGSSAKRIYLNGNPIKFVGITNVDNNPTYKSNYSSDSCGTNVFNCNCSSSIYTFLNKGNSEPYYFTRTGYFYGTENRNYSYKILHGSSQTIVDGTNGEGNSTSAYIYNQLEPGRYTFKTCINGDSVCDSVDFNATYDIGIEYDNNQTSVSDGEIVQSNEDIKFAWKKDGGYPENFIGSPKFDIELIDTYSENVIFSGKTSNTSYTLTDETKGELENGRTYTFIVYILDTEGNRIQADNNYIIDTNCYGRDCYDFISGKRSFSVSIPEIPIPKITIDRPINPETGAITDFSWTPNIDPDYFDFNNYYWSISGVDNSTLLTGLIMDINNTGFSTGNLNNGSYTFNVMLNYTKRSNGETGVATDDRYSDNGGAIRFTVAKTYPSIKINRPLENETGAITYFSWTPNVTSGFSFNNYEWVISGNNAIYTGKIMTGEITGFTRNDLNNGTYTFNVKLNYTQNSNGETGYAVDSRYASYGGSMTFEVNKTNSIRITNPSNGSTGSSANVTFTWEKNLSDTFSGYEIILTGGNNNINTREIIKTESTTTRTVNDLRDGSYRFKVIMHYTDSSNNPQTREDDITFYIDASAGIHINITKPSNGSNFITGGAREIPIEFEWNGGGSTLISGYSYTIKKGSTTIEQGTRGKNESGIYTLGSKDLSGGTYTFTVTMLAKNGAQMIDESSTFTVVILSDLNILSPQDGDIFVGKQDVQFSRSGFAEFSHYKYSYTLEKTKKGTKTTIKSGNNLSLNDTGFTQFLENGNYEFTVRMMDGSSEIKKKTHRFEVLDITGLVLTISDGSSSWNSDTNRIEIKTGTVLFNYGGKSEDFSGYYYSITGTNFKGETFIYTGKNFGELTGSLTLTGLLSGKYRFVVRMVDDSNSDILTGKLDFNVTIPSKLTITNPTSGSIVTSSSTTLSRVGNGDIFRTGYSTDSRHYEYELLQVTASGNEQKASSPKTNANSFSYTSFQDGASYQLTVKLYSGNTFLTGDSSSFSVSIPKHSSGGGGGSSSKSHPTNDLSVSVTNDEPITNERVEVVVDINDKYTGKVDFTKMQYYSFDEEKRIDIPVTSKNYVSDYSDDAKLGYVKFDSSDRGEKNLSEFLMFSQPGNYRIHVEDKDGYKEYTEFYVGKGNKTQVTAKAPEEDEYYIARSCKKYKIEFLNNLGVYTSPNLKQDEYFVSKDYFKRYIDSKNKRADGCPTNIGWITTTYRDTSNSSDRYTAPNGKVYFINGKNGSYSSTELDKELNGSKKFGSVTDLKYFIRDRNPFISMAKLGPTTAK